MRGLGFLQNIGPGEWFFIFIIILLLFGATRIPQLMRSLGRGVKEFKKGMHESDDEDESAKRDGSAAEKKSDPDKG